MGLFDSFAGPGKSFSDLKKYVEDFEIMETRDRKGRARKEARYIGPWTVLREAGGMTRVRLWSALGMAACLTATYIRMLLLNHLVSGQLLVMLPLLAGLFPSLYLIMGVTALPFRGRPMRRDQYMHSFIRSFRSATAAGVCVLVGEAAALIARAIAGDWLYRPEDWHFTVLGIFILAAAAGVIGLLRAVDVTEKPNSAYRDPKKT